MDQETLIARLWALTEAITHAASVADWPEAARLAELRSPLFAMLTAAQTPVAMQTIRRLQAVDAALIADAQATQLELQSEYLAGLSRLEATSQYHRVAGF